MKIEGLEPSQYLIPTDFKSVMSTIPSHLQYKMISRVELDLKGFAIHCLTA